MKRETKKSPSPGDWQTGEAGSHNMSHVTSLLKVVAFRDYASREIKNTRREQKEPGYGDAWFATGRVKR